MREILYVGMITLVEEGYETRLGTDDGAYIGW